ncbi:MAG: hypothetical protein WDA16_06380 [Candidatus Thermoplasmatota archaeon]
MTNDVQLRSALRRLYATHKLLNADETACIAQLLGIPPDDAIRA